MTKRLNDKSTTLVHTGPRLVITHLPMCWPYVATGGTFGVAREDRLSTEFQSFILYPWPYPLPVKKKSRSSSMHNSEGIKIDSHSRSGHEWRKRIWRAGTTRRPAAPLCIVFLMPATRTPGRGWNAETTMRVVVLNIIFVSPSGPKGRSLTV